MRFQCPFCFTIIRPPETEPGGLVCPSCSKRVARPRTRFEAGCVIDDFVIDSLIAHGGMATVYLARQLSMDRHVAMKVLKSDYLEQESFVASFMKEAKSAARLNHPNLIQALAVGEDDGVLFYVMEYVKGETLAGHIEREKNLDLDEALNIIQQSAEALHAAWTREGLIHRDIKPDNIMLVDNGIAKVMDLGIAISKYESENAEISGTPTFMAPEQFRRNRLDCRTDIYALGATLYNCLVGYPPFDGDRVEEIARMHLFEQLEFPDRNLIYLPQRVKRLISKMMAKSPDDRFADYEELLEEVVAIRRRLAPDDNLVPSVHTISFSKYRLREEMQESPSEIYRRRSEKKKNIAIAKQQASAPGRHASRVVPLLTSIMVLLVLIIVGLLWLVWHASNADPRLYVERVHTFLTENDKLLAAEIVEPDTLELALRRGERIADNLPADSSESEQEAYYQLKDQLYALNSRLLAIRTESLTVRTEQFSSRLKDIETEREKLRHDHELLDTDQAEVEAMRREMDTRAAELEARESAQRQRDLETEKASIAATAMRDSLIRPLKYQLQLRMIDLIRNHQFTDAIALCNPRATDNLDLNLWRDLKRREISDAELLINTIAANGARFKGVTCSRGTIQTLSRTVVRYTTTENGQEVVRDAPLAILDARELTSMAAMIDPPVEDLQRKSFYLALCYGNFELAQHFATGEADLAYLDTLITGCYQAQLEELTAYLAIGQRTLAKAKAVIIRTRYERLSGYTEVEKLLVELLKTGRLTPLTSSRTTEDPEADFVAPGPATLGEPAAPAAPGVSRDSTAPKTPPPSEQTTLPAENATSAAAAAAASAAAATTNSIIIARPPATPAPEPPGAEPQ